VGLELENNDRHKLDHNFFLDTFITQRVNDQTNFKTVSVHESYRSLRKRIETNGLNNESIKAAIRTANCPALAYSTYRCSKLGRSATVSDLHHHDIIDHVITVEGDAADQ